MDTQSQPDKPNDEELFDKVVEENEGVVIPVSNKPSEPPVYAPAPVTESEPATVIAPQPVVPSVVPAATVTVPAAVPTQKHGSGGALVLQWISYAFWGWFAASMTFLAGVTIAYFVNDQGSSGSWGGELAYPLASVIVMLIVALAADMFYARHEPEHKSGGSSVIMLFHAVIYTLVAVAALIFAIFSLISMLIDSGFAGDANGQQIALWTSLTCGVLFAALVGRMLLAGKRPVVRKAFWVVMTVSAVVLIVTAIAGPVARASATRTDRLIEDALPQLATSIKEYADQNDKLPATLEDAKSMAPSYYRDKVSQLVDQKLVTYKPNIQPAASEEQESLFAPNDKRSSTSVKIAPNQYGTEKRFYYQLCVTYKEAKENDGYSSPYEGDTNYDVTPSTYSHPKGEVCYDLVTDYNYAY